MKNLKRVLSLGLASVMLLGMMVVGASAKDFTDADSITHGEAVQVLVALNVINGKEDGSYFAPTDNVSRAEMAKMIAVIMQGGTDINTGVKTVPTFTDIQGNWAEQYIEYCADLGIISGRGDGTFDPNGNVTGLEVAKMVLTALGYEAEAYKLTGATWASRTDEVARKAYLYDELSNVVMNQPATRDSAAQMLWNGLQANTVDVRPGQNTNTGEVTWNYYTDGQPSLLEQRYKANVVTGIFQGNNDFCLTTSAPDKGEIAVDYTYINVVSGVATLASATGIFPADIGLDHVGEEVKVVWKNGVKSSDWGPDRNDDIFGVFITGATRVETTTMGKVKDHKNSKAQINMNGIVCEVADQVDVYVNYASSTPTKTFKDANGTGEDVDGVKGKDATGSANAVNSGLTKYIKGDRGDTVRAVFNEKGKVDKIFITASKIAAVTSINSTNVTLNNSIGTIKIADNDVVDGLKKGDVVTVTTLYDIGATGAKAYNIIAKAEKVAGEVEGYLITDNSVGSSGTKTTEKITLSGKTYTCYDKGVVMAGKLLELPEEDNWMSTLDTGANTQNTNIGKDFDLYLVNGYVGAVVKTSKSASNYSVITEVKTGKAGATFSGLQLKVLTSDGTSEIISVSKDSPKMSTRNKTPGTATTESDCTNDIDESSYFVGDIITYTFDKNDLAEVDLVGRVGTDSSDVVYSEKTKTIGATPVASDAVLYVQYKTGVTIGTSGSSLDYPSAEWEAYDLRSLDKITLTAGKAHTIVYNSDGSKVVAVFMDLAKEPDGAGDTTVYGIVSASNGRTADYYLYTIQANGEVYDVYYKHNDIAKGNLVKFRPTADNTYNKGKIEKVAFDGAGWVKEFNAKDNTLTYYYGARPVTPSGETDNFTDVSACTVKTYALAKDAKIIYVDKNGSKSEGEASVDQYSEYTGKANVAFVMTTEDSVAVIKAMFVETSTHKDIVDAPQGY